MEESLSLLSRHYENTCPHEIGIFLGYPVEDVASFIDHPDEKCKASGYWKVYHNVVEAQNTFKRYDQIKYTAMKTMMNSTPNSTIGVRLSKYYSLPDE